LHRDGDALPIDGARYVAERIPNARFVELHGDDHWPWVEDPDEVCDHVEEFVTGHRSAPPTDRVLATVMFTDIVGSTERGRVLSTGVRGCPRHPDGRAQPAAANSFTSSGSGSPSPLITLTRVLASDSALM
jgi:hypothetical protein